MELHDVAGSITNNQTEEILDIESQHPAEETNELLPPVLMEIDVALEVDAEIKTEDGNSQAEMKMDVDLSPESGKTKLLKIKSTAFCGLEFLNKIGSQSQDIAEDIYIQTVSKMKDEERSSEERKTKEDSIKGVGSDVQYSTSEKSPSPENGSFLDDKQTEETRALFSTAESAMEAWTKLATSLGHPSY